MRRIVIWLASTVTVVVLLFGYHTSTNKTATSTPPSVSSSTSSAPVAGTSRSGGARTYTGTTVPTRWGPVQVQLTVSGGTITKVGVLQSPHDNPRDQEINGYALPQLVQETLAAQSGQIDMVSGATVTSQGYLTSLQSALDKAGR